MKRKNKIKIESKIKTITNRTNKEKSILFLLLIFLSFSMINIKEIASKEILNQETLINETENTFTNSLTKMEYEFSVKGYPTFTYPINRNEMFKYNVSISNYISEKDEETKYDMTLRDILFSPFSYYKIPGVSNTNVLGEDSANMVPQGMCAMDEFILVSAYDGNNKSNNSVIYVLRKGTGALITTLVLDSKTHAGGLAYDGKYVWIANSTRKSMLVLKKENILDIVKFARLNYVYSVAIPTYQEVKLEHNASFCTYYENKLWVGVFSSTKSSEAYSYRILEKDDDIQLIKQEKLNLPINTQGISFFKEGMRTYIMISNSYGRRANSKLFIHQIDNYYISTKDDKGESVINKSRDFRTIDIPPMSEQIIVEDNYVFVLFESAANIFLQPELKNYLLYGRVTKPIDKICIFDKEKLMRYEDEVEVEEEKLIRHEDEVEVEEEKLIRYKEEVEVEVEEEKIIRYEDEVEVEEEKSIRYEVEVEEEKKRFEDDAVGGEVIE